MARKASKSSNVAELANKALATRLRELVTDTSVLAKYLDCSIQAVNQYKQGTSQPKIENIIKIADFYNVSVDYLFGITETKNRDTTTQAICQATGLSEKAVEHLTLLNKAAEINSASDNAMTTHQRGQIEALSFLIEHKDFNALLTCLEYLRNPEIFKINERAGFDNLYRMACDLSSPRVEVIAGIQYRGARAFGNIMEDALKQNPANKDKEG